MPRKGARARLALGNDTKSRGPLVWIAVGISVMFLVGVTLFILLSGKRDWEPAPGPTHATHVSQPPR